ncbi:MAG: amino acid adenylation domain-containing protein, partial [Algicola sp.]|nr:amino acid adenylation domain-containing protein [Algicola sp.]
IALDYHREQTHYLALNQQANQLAAYLRDQGIGNESLVGVCLPRSSQMIVCLLAILKAGGAYVPLDSEVPQSRLTQMVETGNIGLILTDKKLSQLFTTPTLPLDDAKVKRVIEAHSNTNLNLSITANALAYVIFTSGSTGKPKGVMVEHQNVVRLVKEPDYVILSGQEQKSKQTIAQAASCAFDAATFEIWGALCNGARLYYLDKEILLNATRLKATLHSENITVLFITTALFNQLSLLQPDCFFSLNYLLFGGELIDENSVTRVIKSDKPSHLVHVYGPTENTTFSSFFEIKQTADCYPIGKAINGSSCYVLDANLQALPNRAIGELYVGGAGVARGYLEEPGLSAQSFIEHQRLGRLYKTGDLVSCLNDGHIVFIGRADTQVKIRGFRIEPGEVELQLLKLPGVDAATVMVREDEPGQKQLVAYVVKSVTSSITSKQDTQADWHHQLQTVLPEYMVPAAIVVIEQMPLTVNGKIDKKALPMPLNQAPLDEFVAPESGTETALAGIWAGLLQLSQDKISANANFFALGGHSLLAIRLIAQVRELFDVELMIRDIFAAGRLAQMAQLIDQNSQQDSQQAQVNKRPPITKLAKTPKDLLPASFAQQRLWFIDQLEGGSPQYNMPGAMQIKGDFDLDIANQAFARIIKRHQPLRSVFANSDSDLMFKSSSKDFTIHSIEQTNDVETMMNQEARKPFDLNADLMLRASYIAQMQNEGVLLFTLHHIACDGWSMGILLREFVTQYQAILVSKPDPLPPLKVEYADYAQWQRDYLTGEVLESQLTYWQKQLADLPMVHSVPLDSPRPKQQTFNGAVHQFSSEQISSKALEQLVQNQQEQGENVTLFMLLHSAFALLLARYGNNPDVVIGTPVANRLHQDLEPLVGFFVNTLVLRVDCSTVNEKHESLTFEQFLARVKQVNLDAQANQDVSFEHLVDRLSPRRSISHGALYQISFSMDAHDSLNLQGADDSELPFTMTPLNGFEVPAKHDLALFAKVNESGVFFNLLYNTDLFELTTIEQMSEHFLVLLGGIINNPKATIAQLPLLSDTQMQQLLEHGGQKVQSRSPQQVKSPGGFIDQMFEHQAKLSPHCVALICDGERLSYDLLNRKVNQLAHYLVELGVGPETLVGLCLERSIDLVVAILAVLKAGGAYVPMLPDYPQKRLAHMVWDSGMTLLLCRRALNQKDWPDDKLRVLNLKSETLQQQLQSYSDENLNLKKQRSVNDLAYMIYTSGTTGQPKGVMVEHANLNSFSRAFIDQIDALSIGRLNAWLMTSAYVFDASLKGLVALARGATLVVPTLEQSKDPQALLQLLQTHEIRVFNSVPAQVENMLHLLRAQELDEYSVALISSGDRVSETLWQKLNHYCHTHNTKAVNAYGPSETTINATWALVTTAYGSHIGKAAENANIYVVDYSGNLSVYGTVGELCISGDCVARGYLNQSELTTERFIENPFGAGRLYKTGDLVRFEPSGNLEYIGRVDSQVKIRGFRVELSEIEQQMAQLTCVDSSVVVLPNTRLSANKGTAQTQLVAYFTVIPTLAFSTQSKIVATVREQLLPMLPEHMIPTAFVILDEMPLNAAGKIDIKALPKVDITGQIADNYVAPQAGLEAQLCDIWQDLLKLNKVGTNDNFFDVGGNSL